MAIRQIIAPLDHPRLKQLLTVSLVLPLALAAVGAGASEDPDGTATSQAQQGDSPVGVTVVIENLAPENGTWLTPTWVGFHNGTFDPFDVGSAASTAVERMAEDGNSGPLSDAFSSSGAGTTQETIQSDTGIPQIGPGETATRTFVLTGSDPANRFFSYLTMVIPSNDAFVGNDDPQAHRVFDNNGNFLGGYITIVGGDVLDAGTEVNDEIPEHTAFFGQTVPDTGVDENGVIHPHPGYLPPGSGGILDDPMFANADFTAPGYQVARITLYRSDTIVDGGEISGVWDVSGSPYIIQGDVSIPAGATLTVEPGVIVYTEDGYGISVPGTLEAIGTEEAPILFTGSADAYPDGNGWRGIRFENTTTTSHLEHCTVEYGDRASTYESGAGIACINGDVELRQTTVRRNHAFVNGAGIYCNGSTLLVEDCDIHDNLISGTSSGEGGGIYCEDSDVTIQDSRILDNDVRTSTYFGATSSRGGGIASRECNGLVAGNVIAGNYLNHSGTEAESSGGGVFVHAFYTTLILRDNTIARNEVHYNNSHGGGVYLGGYNTELVNNAVFGNVGEGVYFAAGGSTIATYNDVFSNSDGPAAGGYGPGGFGTIVQTNHNGDPCDTYFNIFLDPMFVAPYLGDYHLQAGSPCIDAGDPDSPPSPDGTIADIGALDYDQGTSDVPEVAGGGPAAVLLLGNRPEPVSSTTAILYRDPDAGPVRLTVYDLEGRMVRTLVDRVQAAGPHQVEFDGRDDQGRALASGVYFYHLVTSGREESRRLTILR